MSIDFERFADYWEGSPKGNPAISKLSVRFVPDATTEMTELLAGRADWIWNINPDQFDNVNKLPTVQAVRKESMRVGYMDMDSAGRSGKENNPMTNLKVRQAVWHAIDRQAMADKLVTGGSRVPPAPCFPPQFGCDGDAAVKYAFDPAKAKALLAEAGYPNGFDLELASYVLPQWGSAVQNYLQAVGIRAKLNQLQVAACDPALHGRRAARATRQLGQLLDQRRFGDHAELLRRRRSGLRARSRDDKAACRRRFVDRPGRAQEGLLRRHQAHHRAGLLAAAAHLRDDLRLHAGSSTSRPTPTSCRVSIWPSGSECECLSQWGDLCPAR